MPVVELNYFNYAFDYLVLPLLLKVLGLLAKVFVVFLALVVYAWMKYRFPLRLNAPAVRKLIRMPIRLQLLSFLRWVIVDACYRRKRADEFDAYGLRLYCGRQGSGKTTSMIHYANGIHKRFPDCLIVSNFRYQYATHTMESWRDFIEIRNGKKGVLFLIDEIHSEFSSAAWKDFPENLLTEISQQRKQRVQICATSQVFTRVVKQIREQTDIVIQCSTVMSRWTFGREYDAKDYEIFAENAGGKKSMVPLRKTSFVQDNSLRACFDTYEKIKRLEKMDFIPRNERG